MATYNDLGNVFPYHHLCDTEFQHVLEGGRMGMDKYKNLKFEPFEIDHSFTDIYNPDNNLCSRYLLNLLDCSYCDQQDYNIYIDNQKKTSSIITSVFLNIRSLVKNLDEFLVDFKVNTSRFDIISFCETRLTPELNDLFSINNYSMYSMPRNTRGGGVVTYVSKKYDAIVIPELSFSNDFIESIFIEMVRGDTKYLVGCLYRPPSSSMIDFINKLNDMHETIRNSFKDHVTTISGDFNINCCLRSTIIFCSNF